MIVVLSHLVGRTPPATPGVSATGGQSPAVILCRRRGQPDESARVGAVARLVDVDVVPAGGEQCGHVIQECVVDTYTNSHTGAVAKHARAFEISVQRGDLAHRRRRRD